jgi:small subunit ribosomal protein S16
MLVIRYFRTGKKNQPYFKIVVTDKRMPTRGGRFKEEVGFVDPVKKIKKVNAERAKYWLSQGAQPSDTVYNLFVSEKILEGKKRDLHHEKKVKEGAAAPAAAPATQGAPATPVAAKEAPAKEEKPAEPAKEEPKAEEKPVT